jgi:hypothetical protein
MGLAIGSSSFAFAAFTLAAHYAGKPPSSLTVVSSRSHMSVAALRCVALRCVALRCVVRRAVVECCALECCREQWPQGSARLGSVTPRPAIGPRRACNCRARSRSTMSTRHRHLRSFRTAHSSKAAEVPHRRWQWGILALRAVVYVGRCILDAESVVCAASPVGASSSVPVGAYL